MRRKHRASRTRAKAFTSRRRSHLLNLLPIGLLDSFMETKCLRSSRLCKKFPHFT